MQGTLTRQTKESLTRKKNPWAQRGGKPGEGRGRQKETGAGLEKVEEDQERGTDFKGKKKPECKPYRLPGYLKASRRKRGGVR